MTAASPIAATLPAYLCRKLSFMSALGFPDHTCPTLLFLIASALTAGLARGFSGFGGALIFVPLASAAVGPKLAAPLLLVVDAVAAAGLVPGAWRRAAKREVGTMAVGAALAVPLGVWLLTRTDPLAMRWALAVMVAGLLALLISGWRYEGRRTTSVTVGVGGLAGLLSGSAQIGGPPVVAFWLSSTVRVDVVRANIVLYFAISSVFSGVAYLAGGLITNAVLMLALLAGPAYGLGIYVGSRLFGLASETTFRRICHGLVGIAAVVSLPIFDGVLR
jgi:uncharacterized protein